MSFSMGRKEINEYMNDLSKEIKKEFGHHVRVEVVLVGGAAMILQNTFRDMSTDIDGFVSDGMSVKAAIHRVADKRGIPDSWFNSGFIKTASFSHELKKVSKLYRTFNQCLDVRIIENKYIIAMKLVAFRQYKNDLSDVVGMVDESRSTASPITLSMIIDAFHELYGDDKQIPDRAMSFLQDVLDKNLTYDKIRSLEIDTRDFVKEIDHRYPQAKTKDILKSLDALN